ncbi:H-NS family nucleoid-associated regulatory protein [Roseococcus sp.]|uniref:H-NS histone family protein n=1 Tax=Roseococcus sp. TaxID=2109646 RepID=UPI003BAB3822
MPDSDGKLATLLAALPSLSMEELGLLSHAIEKARSDMATAGRAALLEEFRLKAERLGLSIEELVGVTGGDGSRLQRSDAGKKVAAKYRGPNGEEWTGRGRMPTWMATAEAEGHGRDEFLI